MILKNYIADDETTFTKESPLAEIYRSYSATCKTIAGWNMATHFNDLVREKDHLEKGSLLVDWSHIGKITLRGKTAEADVAGIESKAAELGILQSCSTETQAILRLTADEFLILCMPGEEAAVMEKLSGTGAICHGGGMGCFVLAGNDRDAVLERSTAMNLRRDLAPPGTVIQTTVHTVRCTLYRTENYDLLLYSREYSVSLFEALIDVGIAVGLIPSGLDAVPVNFNSGETNG
ncbi:MAG: hypothetical protein HRT89_09155 [Lentisphaeria bacterium]|nr:hypothetical protein [Lentisphaeria bacterium]NQZ68226.1 hypothetical protein [Lentisphaeria bacterium]